MTGAFVVRPSRLHFCPKLTARVQAGRPLHNVQAGGPLHNVQAGGPLHNDVPVGRTSRLQFRFLEAGQ